MTAHLSNDARQLLAKLQHQQVTSVFEAEPAAELIEQGYAERTGGGLAVTAKGLTAVIPDT